MRNITPINTPMIEKALLSFCARMVWRARRTASRKAIGSNYTMVEDGGGSEGWWRSTSTHLHHPPPPSTDLFIPQRLDRVETRRFARRIDTEQQPRDRGSAEGEDDGAERHVGGNRRSAGEHQRNEPAHDHADDLAHQRERRGFDQELPQDLTPRRAERLAHADLPSRSEERRVGKAWR